MDLSSLRYLDAVARHGSLTAAAKALRVAQPTLTLAMRNLEKRFGTTLLIRYVLDNRWKHNPRRPDFFVEQDFCSSLAWLESAVVAPRTWLLQNAERALQLRREVQ
jgi:hypothetical protein